MDTAGNWTQIVLKPMEEMATSREMKLTAVGEKRPRPAKDEMLSCPRCNSTNTKFCYYNNYSLTQPRYFCKTCRRYWTQGGTLRNIPVGGGSRKNKQKLLRRDSDLSMSSSLQSPPSVHQLHDLSLGFPKSNGMLINVSDLLPPHSSGPVIPVDGHNHAASFPAVFPFMQDFKSGIDFNLDLMGNNSALESSHDGSRLLFPFDNLKPGPSNRHPAQSSGGYWTGLIGGGSW